MEVTPLSASGHAPALFQLNFVADVQGMLEVMIIDAIEELGSENLV